MKLASEGYGRSGPKKLLFLSLVFISAATAPVTRADLSGEALTNLTQVTSYMSQPGMSYPLVTLWEPAMFEPLEVWWADFTQLNELAAIQNYPGYTLSGITVWPLQITEYPTGEVAFKHPWLDAEFLRLEASESEEAAQRYDDNLRVWCILHGMNPVPFAELIAGPFSFLDPKQVVLRVWLADVNDWPTYYNNLMAEQAAAEAEAAAAASGTSFSQISSLAMGAEESGEEFGGGSVSCSVTNLADPFYITSIQQDTNLWTTITWQSCPLFRYIVWYANELNTNTAWMIQAYVWGQPNTTSWTDATTTNGDVIARFYKVQKVFGSGNAIAAGASHTVAVSTNGVLFAWGTNDEGQIGLGYASPPINPLPVQAFGTVCMGFISNVVAVAAGGRAPLDSETIGPFGYSIAVDSAGVVWTWGWNALGQLGNGAPYIGPVVNAPTPISGVSNVVSVAAGMEHALALRADGTVWGWGRNDAGQLGVGATFLNTNSPVQSAVLTQIVAIAAGGNHSAALDQNGRVWTWGNNNLGQLGLGSAFDFTNVPVLVTAISNVIAVAGGWDHTLALTPDNKVWTWGGNEYGQLGLGSVPPYSTNLPTLVTVTNIAFAAIAGGDRYSLAATTDGRVYAWGDNGSGQCGANTNIAFEFDSPHLIEGISNAVLVCAPPQDQGKHSLAVTVEQGVTRYWAWGSSYYGQVGNGLTNQSFSYPCGDFDICTSNNDSNVYAPAGPLEFTPSCNEFIQLGTSGSFTAHCTGTLYLYFNGYYTDFAGYRTNSFIVTIDNGLGTTNVPGNVETGVAIGTVTNGVTYTYSATGLCYHCSTGGSPDCPSDPDGKDDFGQKWNCSGTSPCTLICPEFQCYSLVGRIK